MNEIIFHIGFGDETEYVKNIMKAKALAEFLEEKNIKEITLEFSPEALRELLYESANFLTGNASTDTAIVIKSEIQVESETVDCEIVSIV